MKDHIITKVVNDLRDAAIKFHATGQLRERMRAAIEPLLPDIAPPVASGSVDTGGMLRHSLDAGDMMEYATGNYVLYADAIAWGAQQREAALAEQLAAFKKAGDCDQAEFNRKWTEQKARADKAEARVKVLEGEMNRTAAGDAFFELLPNQIHT